MKRLKKEEEKKNEVLCSGFSLRWFASRRIVLYSDDMYSGDIFTMHMALFKMHGFHFITFRRSLWQQQQHRQQRQLI